MAFDLATFLNAVADVVTPYGWTRAVLEDTPPDSATTDMTFGFGEPMRGKPLAMSGSGGVYQYTVPLRFVRHVDPNDDRGAYVGPIADALNAIDLTPNWPSGVWQVAVRPLATFGATVSGSRVLTSNWYIDVQAAEDLVV